MHECDSIFMSIRRISRAIDLHSKRLAKTSGLSVPQLLVLRAVHQRGAVPIRAIARDVWLSQATVTTIIDRLESHGYLNRERSREDRRVVHIILTQEGEAKLEATPGLMQEDFIGKFSQLDGWERQMLMSSLDRIARMLTADEAVPLQDPEETEPSGPAEPDDPKNGNPPKVAA